MLAHDPRGGRLPHPVGDREAPMRVEQQPATAPDPVDRDHQQHDDDAHPDAQGKPSAHCQQDERASRAETYHPEPEARPTITASVLYRAADILGR